MLSSYLALWAGFEPSTTYLGTYDQLHNSVRANIALNCYSSFSASSQYVFIVSFFLANFFHHSFLTYYDAVFGFLHFLFLSLPASMLTLPFPDLETRNCSLLYVAPLKVGGCEGRKEGRKGACTNTPWPCASGVGLFLLKANVGRPGKAKWPFIYIP